MHDTEIAPAFNPPLIACLLSPGPHSRAFWAIEHVSRIDHEVSVAVDVNRQCSTRLSITVLEDVHFVTTMQYVWLAEEEGGRGRTENDSPPRPHWQC